MSPEPTTVQLSEREKQILHLMAQGKTNQQIGRELCLSTYTIKSRVQQLYTKLDAHGRTNAVLTAMRLGLVPTPGLTTDEPAPLATDGSAPSLVPAVRVTQYTVSCLPLHSPNAVTWQLTVEERSPGQWAVVLNSGFCLGADGEWEYETLPSERGEWLATHRFDLDTALRLAQDAAPMLRINGKTADEVWAWEQTRTKDSENGGAQ